MQGDMQKMQQMRQQQQQKKEQRDAILKSLLTPEASSRLAGISVVKPEKAEQLKNYLAANARNMRSVDDKMLAQLLAKFAESQQATKVVISRRSYSDSDSDDNDDDLL